MKFPSSPTASTVIATSASIIVKTGGFTMIEALVAMTVLAVGLLGNFMALVQASNLSREGQLRQYKTMLVDTKMQRLLLADKSRLPTMVGGLQTISDARY